MVKERAAGGVRGVEGGVVGGGRAGSLLVEGERGGEGVGDGGVAVESFLEMEGSSALSLLRE